MKEKVFRWLRRPIARTLFGANTRVCALLAAVTLAVLPLNLTLSKISTVSPGGLGPAPKARTKVKRSSKTKPQGAQAGGLDPTFGNGGKVRAKSPQTSLATPTWPPL